MKPLVYLAAPYRSDPVANTHAAIRVGIKLHNAGTCAVFIPHLTLLADLVTPQPVQTWLDYDLDILDHADALWRLSGASAGADAEVRRAEERGIPVFTERQEVLDWAQYWKPAPAMAPTVALSSTADVPGPFIRLHTADGREVWFDTRGIDAICEGASDAARSLVSVCGRDHGVAESVQEIFDLMFRAVGGPA